jgi:hypothetical protein
MDQLLAGNVHLIVGIRLLYLLYGPIAENVHLIVGIGLLYLLYLSVTCAEWLYSKGNWLISFMI